MICQEDYIKLVKSDKVNIFKEMMITVKLIKKRLKKLKKMRK